LGSGEKDLRQSLAIAGAKGGGRGKGEEFTKQGRVNWSLARRIQLLSQVQRLGESLGVIGDVGYTCETAEYFYADKIKSLIEKFEVDSRSITDTTDIAPLFPFSEYFSDTPEPLFCGDLSTDLESVRGCFKHITKLFQELQDLRYLQFILPQSMVYFLCKTSITF